MNTIMNESNNTAKGYVYILEVKDIDLPVCKIGMTTRNPDVRCAEINNSSKGDFIWEVAHFVTVDDCKKLEALVHQKLMPLRQKNREFFNINADIAEKALLSILNNQSEIKKIIIDEIVKPKKKNKKKITFNKIDSKYTEILQSFTRILNIKGRPFGQLNKPGFGMSDDNNSVQWNIGINPDTSEIKVGVNLEGLAYNNWPIATLILSELENPSIEALKSSLENPEGVFVSFTRDAWQVTSRPDIDEKYLGVGEIPISDIDTELWISILKEALGCLNEKKSYCGRNKQTVTLVNKPKNGEQVRIMDVSPHLTIRRSVDMNGDISSNLENEIEQLKPVYEWMTNASQEIPHNQ